MSPKISDGDYCIFKKYGVDSVIGSREGEIVLVEKYDSITETNYVIKEYHHEGKGTEYEKIILHSLNDKYDDIELTDQYDLNDSISVKGVFVGAIKSPLSCLDAE